MAPVKGANLSPARRARDACRFETSRARIEASVAESALNAESVADRAPPLRGPGAPCAPPQARRALIAAKPAKHADRMTTNIREWLGVKHLQRDLDLAERRAHLHALD